MINITLYVLGTIILILFLINGIKKMSEKNKIALLEKTTEMPYQKKRFMSQAEKLFFETLLPMANKYDCIIFSKVSLREIIEVTTDGDHRYWYNKIKLKSVDFLICNKNMLPLFAIVLEDNTHDEELIRKNGLFLDDLFQQIGIPLKRIHAGGYYDLEHKLFGDPDI